MVVEGRGVFCLEMRTALEIRGVFALAGEGDRSRERF